MQITKEAVQAIGLEADSYMKEGRFAEAMQKYEIIYKTGFYNTNACRRLIQSHQLLLDMKSAGLWYRRLFKEIAFDFKTGTDLLMTLLFEEQHSAKELLELCRQYYPLSDEKIDAASLLNPCEGRKLKLGFLSANFHSHPVYFFLIGALKEINRDHFEVHVFCATEHQDICTKEVYKFADQVHDILILEHEPLNAYLREQELDVLFELDGLVPESMILSLFKRVAPVQVAWAGQFCSTGHPLIDYFLGDTTHIDTHNLADFSEEVILSEEGYITYQPPTYLSEVSELPAKANDFISFGSLNNPKKISDKTVELWAAVLNKLPNSKLLLRFGQFKHKEVCEQLYARFSVYGIKEERFILLKDENHKLFVETYNLVDVCLDSFPYSGGLTTLEALWMGVPVVTLKGDRFSSRHSASHLTQLGLDDLICLDKDSYVSAVVSLVSDLDALAELRLTMRDKMQASSLMNHSAKARELEAFCLKALAKLEK